MSLFVSKKFLRQQTVTSFYANSFYVFKQHSFFISKLPVFYLLQHQFYRLHITGGLALGWQDVVLPKQRFFTQLLFGAGRALLNFYLLPSTSQLFWAAVPGLDIKMSSPTPSPTVGCNAPKHFKADIEFYSGI